MESSARIILSVSIAVLFAFVLITVFVDLYQPTHAERYRNFFSEDVTNGKRVVFLVGASHVAQLNATLINEIVSQYNSDYVVYNIADSEDSPKIRLRTLQDVIATKPQVVFYGISYRDFQSPIDKQNSLLPNPSTSFRGLLGLENYDNYFEKFSYPVLTTLTFIRDEFGNKGLISKNYEAVIPYTPFYSYPPSLEKILTDAELQSEAHKLGGPIGLYIDPPSKNEQLMDLKKIIEELHKNNIKVVVFITPLHRSYLDNLSDYQKQVFDAIVADIKKEPITKIYDFSDRYSDLPIWTNPSHVSYNRNSMIYSEDIAKIISEEIGS